MLAVQLVALVKSLLSKPDGARSLEEERAGEEFYRVCEPVIRDRIRCVRRAQKSESVDDITQAVWIRLMRRLPNWEFDPALGTLEGWVAAIATHEAWRRARRRSRRPFVSLDSEARDELFDASPGPDTLFERMQEHELFGALVAEFAASQRELDKLIIVLHWVEACSLSKIAADRDMSEDRVSWVIRRVKTKLLDYLRRRGLACS
jgi:RNA polymerase sigma factor (sigma-70 family)